MDSLFSELLQRVQGLYDSAPGSSTQREADQWLTSFVNVEGAWEVLLHVLSNAAAQQQQQQQQQSQATDVRLLFISAKILQVRRKSVGYATGVAGNMRPSASLLDIRLTLFQLSLPSHKSSRSSAIGARALQRHGKSSSSVCLRICSTRLSGKSGGCCDLLMCVRASN